VRAAHLRFACLIAGVGLAVLFLLTGHTAAAVFFGIIGILSVAT
jgi:hypothetical protein